MEGQKEKKKEFEILRGLVEQKKENSQRYIPRGSLGQTFVHINYCYDLIILCQMKIFPLYQIKRIQSK